MHSDMYNIFLRFNNIVIDSTSRMGRVYTLGVIDMWV